MTVTSYAEELDRKALETSETLALRHEQGVLSNREFRIAMEAVWNSTSGLSDGMTEVMNVVADMGLADEKTQFVVSDGSKVFIVGRRKLNVTITDCLTMVEGNLKVFFTEVEAVEHVWKLLVAFEKKGFKRVP